MPLYGGRSRRLVLAVLAAVSCMVMACTGRTQPNEAPSSETSVSTVTPSPLTSPVRGPDYAKMKRQLQQRLAGDDSSLKAVRAVLVSVDGETVLSYYHNHRPTEYAHVYSVTKSVMSILVGIAIDEGRLQLNQTLVELLPEYADRMTDQVKSVTLRQLLTMTSGSYGGAEGGGFNIESQDPVGLILSDSFVGEPGAKFVYTNIGVHLVGAILRHATDRPILDYAREKLFDPLGIDTRPAWQGRSADLRTALSKPGFAWLTDRNGTNLACCGLKLTAPDMVKIGQLYLDEGRWQGRQLVSAEWVKESTANQLTKEQIGAEGPYGYLWWIGDIQSHRYFAAVGSYGQYVVVVPDSRLIVVTVSDESGFPEPTEQLRKTFEDVIFAPILKT
jgi:CubicO group peptidase (beta-lactamase class C family)